MKAVSPGIHIFQIIRQRLNPQHFFSTHMPEGGQKQSSAEKKSGSGKDYSIVGGGF